MSFLHKLKNTRTTTSRVKRNVIEKNAEKKMIQLDVDVLRLEDLIVIYSQMPGLSLSDIKISIEGNADIVIIEGKRERPELPDNDITAEGVYATEECVWGHFYRRIVLPTSIDIDNAEAKLEQGVLTLRLPLVD